MPRPVRRVLRNGSVYEVTYYVSSGTLNHAHSVRTQSEQPAVTRTDPGRKKSVVSSGLSVSTCFYVACCCER